MEDYPNVYHLVVPSRDGRLLLVDVGEEDLRLPHVVAGKTEEDEPWVMSWNGHTNRLCNILFHYLNSCVYVRRPLWIRPDTSTYCEELALVVDLVPDDSSGASALPPGLEWMSWEAAQKASWRQLHPSCDTLEMLTAFFQEALHVGDLANRPPWRRASWFSDMTAWVMSVLRENDFEPESELQQYRNVFQSSVLRCKIRNAPCRSSKCPGHARSLDGFVYIKTTLPSIPEAAITSAVSSAMEAFVPKVLATDRDNISFVQLGAEPAWDLEPATVMDGLAKMHLQSLQCMTRLQSKGVPDRGLTWLSANIKSILEGPLFRLLPKSQHLLELQSRVSEVRKICRILMGFGIPHTLVHGDCDMSNLFVGAGPGAPVSFIDWETGSIAYPFYDYVRITKIGWEPIEDETAKDAYLNQWLAFETRDNILKAAALAFPLMLCNNLFVLLRTCVAMDPFEKPLLLSDIDSRLEGILKALNQVWSKVHDESEDVRTARTKDSCLRI